MARKDIRATKQSNIFRPPNGNHGSPVQSAEEEKNRLGQKNQEQNKKRPRICKKSGQSIPQKNKDKKQYTQEENAIIKNGKRNEELTKVMEEAIQKKSRNRNGLCTNELSSYKNEDERNKVETKSQAERDNNSNDNYSKNICKHVCTNY